MSSDWPLRNITEITDSLNHKRVPLSGMDRQNRQGQFPYYGASGIVDYIDDYIFDGTYLLISEDGENLRSRNTPIAFKAHGKFWVNNHAHILDEKEIGILDYLEYYFSQLNLSPYITGAVQPKLNKGNLQEIDVRVPPLEQRLQINDILNGFTKKIHLNQQINETLEAMAQAIFKSWFVDFDPVQAKIRAIAEGYDPTRAAMAAISGVSWVEENWDEVEVALQQKLDSMTEVQQQQLTRTAQLFPDELVDSEIGEVPKGWDLKKVDELADVIDCLHSKKPERQKEGGLYLEVSNIGEAGKLDLSDKYFINEEDYNQWTKRIEVRKGDMVITKTGRVGALAYIPKRIEAAIGRNIVAIRPDRKIVKPSFLRDAMLSDYMKWEIRALTSSGTILQSLHVKAVRKLRLIIPNNELLSMYGDRISEVHEMISENIFQNESLIGLRDTLLPKLISGEVGV